MSSIRLLAGTPQGATDYIEADLRDPGKILQGAAATLDFTKPVAITLLTASGGASTPFPFWVVWTDVDAVNQAA